MSVNSLLLRASIEALRPVRGKLTSPLIAVFEDKSSSESVHTLATDILTDYASDDPDRLAQLLMDAEPKAFLSLLPVAKRSQIKFCLFSNTNLPRKQHPPGTIGRSTLRGRHRTFPSCAR